MKRNITGKTPTKSATSSKKQFWVMELPFFIIDILITIALVKLWFKVMNVFSLGYVIPAVPQIVIFIIILVTPSVAISIIQKTQRDRLLEIRSKIMAIIFPRKTSRESIAALTQAASSFLDDAIANANTPSTYLLNISLAQSSLKDALALAPKARASTDGLDSALKEIQNTIISYCSSCATVMKHTMLSLNGDSERNILMQTVKSDFDTYHDIMEPSTISQLEEIFSELAGYSQSLGSLDYIDGLTGLEFEEYVAGLLKRNGFSDVVVTKASGDQGVDITALKDSVKYAFQCKHYSSKLDNTPVQEIYAGKSFYGCQVGVVVTNNYFTDGACELAGRIGVLLWDRDHLAEMLTN